jgi:hypothetical protein
MLVGSNAPQAPLTVKAPGIELRIRRFTLYRKLEQGELPALRVGERDRL